MRARTLPLCALVALALAGCGNNQHDRDIMAGAFFGAVVSGIAEGAAEAAYYDPEPVYYVPVYAGRHHRY